MRRFPQTLVRFHRRRGHGNRPKDTWNGRRQANAAGSSPFSRTSWRHSLPLAPAPTWSIVSWKHLAPRKFTGTKEEVIALVENDLAAAGIHHLDVQVYDAIHVIVALKR